MNKLLFFLNVAIISVIATIVAVNAWNSPNNDPPYSTNQAVYINPSGDVGIGTIAPNTALDLKGAFSVRGMAAPEASLPGQGRLYFDLTENKFKISENGGFYDDLVTVTNTSFVAARQSADQGISTSPTWNKVTLNVEDVDTGNNFDSTTNYRYTVPQTGKYHVMATAESGSTSVLLKIYKNGAAINQPTTRGASDSMAVINYIFNFIAGDYIELYATTGSGASINKDYTSFAIYRISVGD